MNSTKESLKTLLKNVKTIALVGASPNSKRDSHKVMKYLIKNDYEVFPVNPNEANKKILGRKCLKKLIFNNLMLKINKYEFFSRSYI